MASWYQIIVSLATCLCCRGCDTNEVPGYKRVVLDPGYLKSMQQPNVIINFDIIEEVLEDRLVAKTGDCA